jgi:hypothetical protein
LGSVDSVRALIYDSAHLTKAQKHVAIFGHRHGARRRNGIECTGR